VKHSVNLLRTFEPLGSTHPEQADVRVIAATNKDLKLAVERGTFRQDLYYRINVLSVTLPALRERRCDIPILCDHFVGQYNARYNKTIEGISNDAINQLLAYDFPGNIRELENIIEHAFIFCKGTTIETQHLPDQVTSRLSVDPEALVLARVKNFEDLERLYIQSVLAETGGNKLAAARKLGIHKTTFFRKLKKLKISSRDGSNRDAP
jgi:transcriptional regulator with PAS, ATPase and Fis domain